MKRIQGNRTTQEVLLKNGYEITDGRIFADGEEWGLVKSDNDTLNMRILVNRYGPIELKVVKAISGQVNPLPKKNVQSDKWFALIINEQVASKQETCNITIYDGGEKMRELAFPEDKKRVVFKERGIVHDLDTDTDFVEITPYIKQQEHIRTFINSETVFRIIGDYSYKISRGSLLTLNNGKQLSIRRLFNKLPVLKKDFSLIGKGINLNDKLNEIMRKMKNVVIIYRDGSEKTVSLIHKEEADGDIDIPMETLIELATKEHHSEDYQIDVYFLEDYQADPWIKRFVSICNKFRKAGKHVESGYYNPDKKRIFAKNRSDK